MLLGRSIRLGRGCILFLALLLALALRLAFASAGAVATPAAARLTGGDFVGVDQQAGVVNRSGIDGGQPADLRFAGRAVVVAARPVALRIIGAGGRACRRAWRGLSVDVRLPVLARLRIVAPLLLARVHRFSEQALIMFGVLEKILGHDPVIRGLRVPRHGEIFFNNLLRGAAHLALGPVALEYAVDVIAIRPPIAAAARTIGFLRWSHRIRSWFIFADATVGTVDRS